MQIQRLNEIFKAKLTDDEFRKLSEFIYREYGIKMPPVKKIMLQSRLQKRLRELNMANFKEYVDFVFSKEGQDNEVIHMIDVVSTNKTDFFREPVHFEFMTDVAIPEFIEENRGKGTVKVWSAGSSSGEEAYTIAMTLSECKEKFSGLDFSIFGTDISSRILQTAVEAIYKEARIEGVPINYKRKYFLKSKDRINPTVRIIPELRRKASFARLNFMDNTFNINETFDIIFCRNVLIYFDRETQEKVINKLCLRLKPNGFFFLGHSESITSMQVPLKQIKPTIFRKI
jgi:chemotaxis protein methyltransferase CheR